MSSSERAVSLSQTMVTAWRQYRAGARREAAALSAHVLQMSPANIDALHLLGVLAYEANDQQKAITLLTQAIRIQRRYAPLHGNLALARLAAGDLAGAAASARKAFTLSPSYADAHRVLGLVYYRRGRLEQAIEEFRRAQRLGLDTADLRKHLARAHEDLAAKRMKPLQV